MAFIYDPNVDHQINCIYLSITEYFLFPLANHSMKITVIKSYVTEATPSPDQWTDVKPFVLVKMETDEGLVGWGEAYALNDQAGSIAQLIEELGAYLIGADPSNVRRFASGALSSFAENRPSLSFFSAMSALELALWDLWGKIKSEPVYKLLGGACHERIRLYANFWSTRDHPAGALVEKAVEMKESGFSAVKIYPLRCGSLKLAEDLVRKVRDAIGTDTELMLDLSGQADPIFALQAALRFAQYDPYWVEEPVGSHDLDNLAHITQQAPVRIVTGERLAGKSAFKDVFTRKAANIVNPDISLCGGILSFVEIASMAEAFAVQVSPHNFNSVSVSHAAMLQVSAVTPSCKYAEYFPYFQHASDVFSMNTLSIKDGFASLPEQPGLGIELDESVLKGQRFSYKPLRPIKF